MSTLPQAPNARILPVMPIFQYACPETDCHHTDEVIQSHSAPPPACHADEAHGAMEKVTSLPAQFSIHAGKRLDNGRQNFAREGSYNFLTKDSRRTLTDTSAEEEKRHRGKPKNEHSCWACEEAKHDGAEASNENAYPA